MYVCVSIYELMYSRPGAINSVTLPDLESQEFPGDARATGDILFQLSSNYHRFESIRQGYNTKASEKEKLCNLTVVLIKLLIPVLSFVQQSF